MSEPIPDVVTLAAELRFLLEWFEYAACECDQMASEVTGDGAARALRRTAEYHRAMAQRIQKSLAVPPSVP